jgi:hypothetical protein
MNDKNNQYLVVFTENFFDKIKKFKKKILKKDNIEITESISQKRILTEEEKYEKNKCELYENYLSQQFENQEVIDDIDLYEEEEEENIQCKNREEFFELYENIKNKEKSIEKVSTIDLIKMEEIIKEEILLYKNAK